MMGFTNEVRCVFVNVTGSVYPEVINMPLHAYARIYTHFFDRRRSVLLSHKGQVRDNYCVRETSVKEKRIYIYIYIYVCVCKGRSSIGNARATVRRISKPSTAICAKKIAKISEANTFSKGRQ